jgi:predicted DNA-binding transcriptional regulator YafY
MRFCEQLNKIKRVDALIRRKATGTPDQLADKLEVSRRTIFRIIDDLKELGAPVIYSKFRQSYQYEDDFELKL